MDTVNVGMDLAITSDHWATAVYATGETLLAPRRVARSCKGLEGLWRQVREMAPPGARVRVVVEPTGMAWLPVAVFFWKQGAEVLRPSSAEAADLRRFLRRHAKSDRVDTRVLARLPLVKPEGVPPLQIPNPRLQALERLCKQRQRLVDRAAAIGKRIRSLVELAMPGITALFGDPVGPAARAVYRECVNPWHARYLGQAGLEEMLTPHTAKGEARPLATAVLQVAEEAIALYCTPHGEAAVGLDHDLLQVEVNVELSVLEAMERELPLLERHIKALTQEFTLPAGAQLTFWTWYDIELDWDYGYVEASTDGGATWGTVQGNITTNFDPNGNNEEGNGITGNSGGWVLAAFDLSAYGGETALLRFRYETDAYVQGLGWTVDDISIDGFFDDVESGEMGWTADGWYIFDGQSELETFHSRSLLTTGWRPSPPLPACCFGTATAATRITGLACIPGLGCCWSWMPTRTWSWPVT